jgi:hypothetical protein
MEAFEVLTSNLILLSIKIFFIAVLSLLSVFLVVLLKQIISMNEIVHDTNDSIILRTVSIILLVISVSLLLTSLVIL